MPVFDFKCPECGMFIKDRLVLKPGEVHTQPCPECKTLMERQHTVGKLSFLFNYLAD